MTTDLLMTLVMLVLTLSVVGAWVWEYVERAFESFLEALLWLTLIVFIVGGAVVGYIVANVAGYSQWVHIALAIIGLILGTVVGFGFIIQVYGILVTFVRMGKEIGELQNDITRLSASSTGGEKSV